MTQKFFFADFLGLCNYCLCTSPSAGPCLIILCSLALSDEDAPLLLCGTTAQPLQPCKWKWAGAWLSLNVSEQHLAFLKPQLSHCQKAVTVCGGDTLTAPSNWVIDLSLLHECVSGLVSYVSCLLIPGCAALEKTLLLFWKHNGERWMCWNKGAYHTTLHAKKIVYFAAWRTHRRSFKTLYIKYRSYCLPSPSGTVSYQILKYSNESVNI